MVKNWPEDDRPREKLLKKGAKTLSNAELLAILFRTGTKGSSAVDLAREVLGKFGSFRNMAYADSRECKEFKGLGSAKIAHIQSALEIGRRYREDDAFVTRQKISTAKDIFGIINPELCSLKTEVFKVIYLDSNNRIIGIVDAAQGTVNRAFPIVREIIHSALQKFAASVICAHNHPSGDPKPSKEDRDFTGELCRAGEVMQVKILDHIIIAGNEYYSFAENAELLM